MPAILYPLPKIVKKFYTIVFTGGTTVVPHCVREAARLAHCGILVFIPPKIGRNDQSRIARDITMRGWSQNP